MAVDRILHLESYERISHNFPQSRVLIITHWYSWYLHVIFWKIFGNELRELRVDR
jgi:hypothetical protein